MGFFLRMLVTAAGLWLAQALLSGVSFDGGGTLLVAALLLGIANAVVRPIFVLLTLPITVVTLGLFLLVVNAAMVALVAKLLGGFHLAGFWSALGASLSVSVTSWLASWFIGPTGRYEVLIVEQRRVR